MATAAEIIAALSTVAPDTEMTLPSTCPTPPSSPPSPPNNNDPTPFSWVPKEWAQDREILSIRNRFYVEYAGSLDNTDPFRVSRKLTGLVRIMNAKIALYIACMYGDVGIRRMPFEIRQLLQDQDMGSIGWGPQG